VCYKLCTDVAKKIREQKAVNSFIHFINLLQLLSVSNILYKKKKSLFFCIIVLSIWSQNVAL